MSENNTKNKNTPVFPWICGAIYAAISLLVRIETKNPYEMIHVINCENIIPPVWIFNLFGVLFSFLFGLAAGLIIDELAGKRCPPNREVGAYRGGIFFVGVFFLSIIWYPLFFSGNFLLLSLILSFLATLTALCNGIFWFCVKPLPGVLTILGAAWLFYVFILNMLVILNN